MRSYRVVQQGTRFFVQIKLGLFRQRWEFLNQYGVALDYNHDWEDAEAAPFISKKDAISFMENVSLRETKPRKTHPTIVAWIGDKE